MTGAIQKVHQASMPSDLYARTVRTCFKNNKDFDPQTATLFHVGKTLGYAYAQIASCLSSLAGIDRAQYKKRVGVTHKIMAEKSLRDAQQKMIKTIEELFRQEEGFASYMKTKGIRTDSNQLIYELIEFFSREGVIFLDSERINSHYSAKMNLTSKILLMMTIATYKKTERGIRYLFSRIDFDGKHLTLWQKNELGNLIDHALQYGYTYEDLPSLTGLSSEDLERIFQQYNNIPNTIDSLDLIGLKR